MSAGPNGLAAAIEIVRSDFPVTIVEDAATVGGGARTDVLMLSGCLHDTCSAIHPFGGFSPILGPTQNWDFKVR